ncbi:MAG: DUF3617 domain-containing protein [Burkholderiaceae bacterium]|jgi:hypothetical protein|nr:DUF3617 domain-containing protein [Burkholderiaceae bacterium]
MKAALIGLSAVLIAGVVQAESAGSLKPGLWETRMLKMTLDGIDMLPQMTVVQQQVRQFVAGMPPEQRKQIEATLGAQGGDPAVQRVCISAEMVNNGHAVVPPIPPRADCGEPRFNRSGDHMTFELSCKQGGNTIDSKGEAVIAGDRVASKVESVTTQPGGARHTMLAETQMQFINSDCGGLKPIDQIAKEVQAGIAGRSAAPQK